MLFQVINVQCILHYRMTMMTVTQAELQLLGALAVIAAGTRILI